MRIAYLATADNIHTKRWAEYFAGRGHELFLLCDPPVENPPEGVTIIHPEMSFLLKVAAFRLFPKPYGNNVFKRYPYRREIEKISPDIVHGFESVGYGYAMACSGPYPKVLTPWGNDILLDPKKSLVARHLVTRALKAADAITTNYLELADYLESEFDISKQKIHPFSWGVDLSIFHQGYEEEVGALREKLNIPEDAPALLSSRMMKPYWGIGTIAEALPRILEEKPEVHLIFLRGAGDPEYENRIRNLIQKECGLNRVRFVDQYLSETDMAIHLNLADAFISCPESDLLSISVLEGMACGCAPILSELEAYKKRVEHGVNGLFFEPGNVADLTAKVLYFLNHEDLSSKFSRINVDLIKEKDNWDKNALKMEELYLRLIRKSENEPGAR